MIAPPLSGLRMRTLSGGARHFVEKQHLREDPIPPPHLHALKINNRTLRTTPYPDLCSNEQSALSTGRKSALLAIFACAGIAPIASLPPPRFHRLASIASLFPLHSSLDSLSSTRHARAAAAQAIPPSHHPSQSHRPSARAAARAQALQTSNTCNPQWLQEPVIHSEDRVMPAHQYRLSRETFEHARSGEVHAWVIQ